MAARGTSTSSMGIAPNAGWNGSVANVSLLNTSGAGGGLVGVGFSGSGLLSMYLVGVAAVLRALGVINNATKLAGASGGAVQAVLACAGTSFQQQYATNVQLADVCRASDGCRGILGAAVRTGLPGLLPNDSVEACMGRLFIAVTQARPNNESDVGLLLGPDWGSTEQLVNAAAVSSYVPSVSGFSAVTDALSASGIPSAYDGAFSDPLPTPPGVQYALTVSALAPTPERAGPDFSGLLCNVSALAAPGDNSSAPYVPLNPVVLPQPPRPDIFPGLSGALNISADTWNSYVLQVPDNNTLQFLFDTGRRDAAAWAGKAGVSADAVQRALNATVVA